MRLRWTPIAAEDLESIFRYLTKHHPSFAEQTIRVVYEAARSLRAFPERGRIGELEGTREFVLPRLPYVIVYRSNEDVVEVLRICHGAQDR